MQSRVEQDVQISTAAHLEAAMRVVGVVLNLERVKLGKSNNNSKAVHESNHDRVRDHTHEGAAA